MNFQIEDPLCKTVDKNLQIPLVNGKVMNIPFTAINISEEVNKTGIWKQVNENNQKKSNKKAEKKNKSPKTPRYYFIFKCYFDLNDVRYRRVKKKKNSKKADELKQKLEKKLSIMNEEDEDEGITIKVTHMTLHL